MNKIVYFGTREILISGETYEELRNSLMQFSGELVSFESITSDHIKYEIVNTHIIGFSDKKIRTEHTQEEF
jgi:hypothetical protein